MSSEKETFKLNEYRKAGEIFGMLIEMLPDGGSLEMRQKFHGTVHSAIGYLWRLSTEDRIYSSEWVLSVDSLEFIRLSPRHLAEMISAYMKFETRSAISNHQKSVLKTES